MAVYKYHIIPKTKAPDVKRKMEKRKRLAAFLYFVSLLLTNVHTHYYQNTSLQLGKCNPSTSDAQLHHKV